jgi:hypothetical protein
MMPIYGAAVYGASMKMKKSLKSGAIPKTEVSEQIPLKNDL